jgi:CBS domain-containing protein
MTDTALDALLRGATLAYFEPGQVVLEPGAHPAQCYIVRQGEVTGERPRPGSGEFGSAWTLGPGEMFSLGALVARRPVSSRYQAGSDTFCVVVPADSFDAAFRSSRPFADFCTRQLGHLLDLSRAEAQAVYLSDASGDLGLSSPLGELLRRAPVSCRADTPLGTALAEMNEQKVGSMPVVDEMGHPVGIFTQQDVIGRVVLPRIPLETPMSAVMSSPVLTLPREATAADAVMTMARHAIRHVVVLDGEALAGVVSERDLFALQRLTTRQVSTAIHRARTVDQLQHAAADIRALAKALVAQGVSAGQLTRLLSSLNDRLTVRLIEIVAVGHDLSGAQVCWLALGSEGRHEQTIATDQDNGLVFVAAQSATEAVRTRLLGFSREINEALDRCGYPLCKGGVMASNPRWCATLDEWRATFAAWIEQGDPESLLAASIFFDFRPLWGTGPLAATLRMEIAASARVNRRFLKQMTDNALRNRPPLGLLGGFRTAPDAGGTPVLDLKLNGSSIVVDAARIYALASGVAATHTVERLRESAAALSIPENEVRGVIDAFEFIQLMRLRAQLRASGEASGPGGDNPNRVALADIGAIDQRVLREAFRQVRRIQTRLQLDYPG